jgi:tetratricopeptide (TPR) repeat protein
LRGLPPFVSDDPDRETTAQKDSFGVMFDQALDIWDKGLLDSALATSLRAMAIDTLRADAHFLIAKCLDSLGRKRAALTEYIKARDYDRLRFRMSSDFNDAVRDECDNEKVIFVDIDRSFMENSPDGIIGNELILEHLHPNAHGYFLMGKEYARALRDHQFLASSNEWQRRDTTSDQVLWNNRNLTDIDEIIAKRRTEILTSGWPFQTQVPTVSPVAENDTLGHIAEMVTRAEWTWDKAHSQAAEYYLGRGQIEKAEAEYKTLIAMIPFEVTPYLRLARLYLDQKNYEATRLELLASLKIKPTILAYRALADIAMNRNEPKQAANFYEKTFAFEQTSAERVENGYLLALAYARANMLDRSATQLMQILNIRPDYQPAVKLLSQIRTPAPHP